MEYGVIVFSSTHCAIRTEKALQGQVPIQLMPTLRNIAVTCGISIRFRPADYRTVRSIVESLRMDPQDFSLYGVRHTGEIVDFT